MDKKDRNHRGGTSATHATLIVVVEFERCSLAFCSRSPVVRPTFDSCSPPPVSLLPVRSGHAAPPTHRSGKRMR